MTHLRLYDPSTHTVVPREPDDDLLMATAFAEAFYSKRRSIEDWDISDWWTAMLAAAPDASRPLPTRERLAVEIYNSHCPQTDTVWYLLPEEGKDIYGYKNIYRRIADAVLALLEGNGKQ